MLSNRKRFTTLLLVFVFVLTLFLTACSSKNENEVPSAAPEASTATATAAASAAPVDDNPFAEHMDITIMGFGNGPAYPADNPVQKLLEEKFNVTFKLAQVDIASEEQRNLYFAEGNKADLILALGQYDSLIEQGVFQSLDLDYIASKMPNYVRDLETVVPFEIAKGKVVSPDGKYYAMPWANYAAKQAFVQKYRKDWLDAVGITKLPETIDEYTDMLRKFTTGDPDKNGKKDTFGTSMRMTEYGAYVYGAFGIPDNALAFYADEAGKIYPLATSENRKKMLKQIAAWYKEGIIDPEMVTDTRALQRDKWQAGKFGVLSDHPWWFAPSTATNIGDSPSTVNPAAVTSYMLPFTGPDGLKGTSMVAFAPGGHGFYIGKDTSPAKLDRILAIQDGIAADEQLHISMMYGEKGVTYDLDADGMIVPKEEYLNPENMGKAGIGEFWSLQPITWDFVQKYTLPKKDKEGYDASMTAGANVYPTDVNFPFSGKNEALTKYTADLTTMFKEFEVKVVRGEVDVDKEWAGYTERFLKAGGQEIVDEYQKLHDAAK